MTSSASLGSEVMGKHIYVIYRIGGLDEEKLCPSSLKRPEPAVKSKVPVNNRFIFSLKTIKLQTMRLCHFNLLLKTFLN